MALDALMDREEPSWWQQALQDPNSTIARALYVQRQRLALRQLHDQSSESAEQVTVVCVSDTHNNQPQLPPGDILIHAGDLTKGGSAKELQDQLDWLDSQTHAYKIVIAGNHDKVLDATSARKLGFTPKDRESLQWGSIIYLERSSCSLQVRGRTLHIFGHPSSPKNGDCWTFQHQRGVDVFRNTVPEGTDILVTHCPPQFHLDAGLGDAFLLTDLRRIRPKLHIFGHIHQGHGSDVLMYDTFESLFVQVCSGRAGVLALIQMAVLLLWLAIVGVGQQKKSTRLVNAAVAEGILDRSNRKVHVVRL